VQKDFLPPQKPKKKTKTSTKVIVIEVQKEAELPNLKVPEKGCRTNIYSTADGRRQ
jgi:hypothetical protein